MTDRVACRSTLSWIDTGWIMLANVVGTSLLTFSYVAAQLGWLPTLMSLVGACCLAIYTAHLMSVTFDMLSSRGLDATSMGEVARHTLGGDVAAAVVYTIVYGYTLLGNASYVLVLGQSLQGALFTTGLCLPAAVLASACACAPLVCSIRSLRESTALCFANLVLLVGVVVIVLASVAIRGRESQTGSPAIADDLSVGSFFSGFSNILYGYAGHWLYFELMAEMRSPIEFVKVFVVNTPVQLVTYLLTAGVAYYFVGSKAGSPGLVEEMPRDAWYQVASAALFLHVVVVFLVKSVVLTRFLALYVAPECVQGRTIRLRLTYAGLALAMLGMECVVGLLIPSFSLLLGLIGALFAGPISYLFPVLFYVGAVRLSDGDSGSEGLSMAAVPQGSWDGRDSLVSSAVGWKQLGVAQLAGFALIAALVAVVAAIGTASGVVDIAQQAGSDGPLFACKPDPGYRGG
mmetsp:Transcript_66850/g.178302  ORF Transcript_66850/g.178302 Transcript_66850/m.178302 type:complete len:460 (+) Transcript_66850:33-1412(+)